MPYLTDSLETKGFVRSSEEMKKQKERNAENFYFYFWKQSAFEKG